MKKTIQALALILAIGATIQTIKAYAFDTEVLSAEEEGRKVVLLIELRHQTIQEQSFTPDPNIAVEFPTIKSEADLKVSLVKHVIRYIFAIGAEGDLIQYLKSSEVQSACVMSASKCSGEPGI